MADNTESDAQAEALDWFDRRSATASEDDIHALALQTLFRGLGTTDIADSSTAAKFFRLITERISSRPTPNIAPAPQPTADIVDSRHRALFNSSPIGISITTADEGRILFVNNWWAASYGRSVEELVGTHISDYYPDPKVRADLLQRMRREGSIHNEEIQVKRADGQELTWVLISLYPTEFEGQTAILAWIDNINERKVAEAELHVSQQRLQDFADATADWFWETDTEHRFTYISEGFERATGFKPARFHGSDRRELIRVSMTTSNDLDILKKLETREPVRDYTHRFPVEGKTPLWVRSSSLPIYDQQGEFIGYRGAATNITDAIETRLNLQSIADRYLNAIDSMSEGVALWDKHDRLVVSNRRFQEFGGNDFGRFQTGIRFEDLVRATAKAGAYAERGDALEAAIQVRLKAHRYPPSEFEIRLLNRTLSVREQRTPDGGTISIVIDMTLQRQFEEQLHQAQKMGAVGQLTGGIAHDFNNLLAVISGNLELLERRAMGDEDLLRFIMRGLAAADRGADLTNRLLAFSRRQPLAAQSATLNGLINGMQDLVQRTLGETIQIRTKMPADPWRCQVDVSQLESAILNLAINARDAMPNGGDLIIETTNLDLLDEDAAGRQNLKPGQYVTLSVSDTGDGMTAEVMERAFDPFFTTKDVDKGTGLGLSMVYGFVQQSGGQVRIDSTVGKGTTVTIYLQSTPDAKVQDAGGEKTKVPQKGRGETVLVVEDDGDVREIAVAMLTDLGYQVLQKMDGKGALALLNMTPDVDLLLSDVVLPGGMSGRALAAAARIIRPEIRVLFMSGYTKDTFAIDGHPEPGDQLLAKPFRSTDLAQSIRRALAT